MAERFTIWTEKTADDRTERYCRDNVTGAETSRPDGPAAVRHIEDWKAAQCKPK